MSDLVERARNWWSEAMDERDAMKARIEALEAALAAEVNAPARVRLEARIEALEAAGKGLAEAAIRLDADDITSALAAWRAAEKGYGDE